MQCIAERDMLSAESVGGTSTWTFSGDIPLLSAAEVFEVYVLYVQGGQKKKDVVLRGTAKMHNRDGASAGVRSSFEFVHAYFHLHSTPFI